VAQPHLDEVALAGGDVLLRIVASWTRNRSPDPAAASRRRWP
jgi:hypothetical protein